MSGDVTVVLVSAVVAAFNPSLLAAITVMLLLPHPKRLMLGYLLGAYTTSIVSGLVIVFSLHGSNVVKSSSHLLSPNGDIAIGAVALGAAFVLATGRDGRLRTRRARRKAASAQGREPKESWKTRKLGQGSAILTFVVGAAISFPGVSYVNALDHIADLNRPTVTILLLIVYFCLMQQMLLELALLASLFAGEWTQRFVVRLRTWFTVHGRQLTICGLSGVGVLLAARGALGY